MATGFLAIFIGGILGIAGITGSSIHSIVQGKPDHAKKSLSGSSVSEGVTTSKVSGGGWKLELDKIASKKKWNAKDWLWIIEHESSGNPNSVNSSSGAFGLGQFLPSNKAEYPGAFSHNPNTQIREMGRYIANRYGNPTAARRFHEANGWY